MRYTIIISTLFLFSCTGGSNKTSESDIVTTTSQPLPDSLKDAVRVTPFEMKDDSVFTDGTIPSSWENAGFTDVPAFKLFLKQMQEYIMNNDKEKLAAVIRYPLKNIKDEKELVEKYDAVFTKDVKLSFATINFNQIFRNQEGAMTTGGKVWFAQQGKDFKIIAINP